MTQRANTLNMTAFKGRLQLADKISAVANIKYI